MRDCKKNRILGIDQYIVNQNWTKQMLIGEHPFTVQWMLDVSPGYVLVTAKNNCGPENMLSTDTDICSEELFITGKQNKVSC